MLHRDFTDASILDDFGASLERSLRGQLTESALYMGMFYAISLRSFMIVKLFRDKSVSVVRLYVSYHRIKAHLADAN